MRTSHSHSYRQVPSMSPPCEAQPRRPRESGSSVRRVRGCGSGLGARGGGHPSPFSMLGLKILGDLSPSSIMVLLGHPTVSPLFIESISSHPDPLPRIRCPSPPIRVLPPPHIDIGTARYTHPIKRTLSIVLSQPPSTLTMKTTTVAAVLASAAGANAQWFGQAPECAVRLTPQHALCNPST